MKIVRSCMYLITLLGMLAGFAGAQADTKQVDPHLAATLAKLNEACEKAKQTKAALAKAAQSTGMTSAQKAQATETLKGLDHVISSTTELLHDPAVTRGIGDPKEIAGRVYSAVQVSALVEREAQQQLGIAPASPTERLLEKNKSLMYRFSQAWDGSSYSGNDDHAPGGGNGTKFFRGSLSAMQESSVVYVSSSYQPSTPQSAEKIQNQDRGIGGGVMLEGSARGLGPLSSVKYDARYNALIMNDRLIYFITMPPWDAAALCAEIDDDPHELVGVSEGSRDKDTVYFGLHPQLYKNTGLAQDVMLTDAFLGGVNFGGSDFTAGYKFADGYEPKRPATFSEMIVRFAFGGFTFTAKDGELALSSLTLDVTMMPVDKKHAVNGSYLPDYAELRAGWAPPPEYVDNAQYIASHVEYFRSERIIARTVSDGALAALFRSYKESGVNLKALASHIANGT